MRLAFLAKYREAGLLLLRLVVGVTVILVAAPILMGGAGRWAKFGAGMSHVGIHAHLAAWGFIGALLECTAGVLILFGLFFRLGVLVLLIGQIFRTIGVLATSAAFYTKLTAVELAVLLFAVLLLGPGRFSVDKT